MEAPEHCTLRSHLSTAIGPNITAICKGEISMSEVTFSCRSTGLLGKIININTCQECNRIHRNHEPEIIVPKLYFLCAWVSDNWKTTRNSDIMTNFAHIHHRNGNRPKDLRSYERKRMLTKRKILQWYFCKWKRRNMSIFLYCDLKLNVNVCLHPYLFSRRDIDR